MATSWYDFLFGPLRKSWCEYWMVGEVITLVFAFATLAVAAWVVATARSYSPELWNFTSFLVHCAFAQVAAYLHFRIMHTVCVGDM